VGQPSTVFGLVGPWGSGKTTLLRDVESNLADWTRVWFSPWSVVDVGSVTSEFLATLSEAFPQQADLKSTIAKYARFGAPMLNLIPFAGAAAADVVEKAIAALSERPPWQSAFSALSADIAEQRMRVLMIIDDVDRLDGEELRALLRVVRLLGRFTNVHYLMAYDETTIARILSAQSSTGDSSEFMEKIVQYPFEVPPVSLLVRRRWSREIVEILDTAPETSDHRETLVGVLALALETPRAVGRLREQILSLRALFVAAEVNALDYIALTWLRIAHHRVWEHIRLNRSQYVGWSERDSDQVRELRAQVLHAHVDARHTAPVDAVVSYLFDPPTVMSALAGERRWRMQHPRYFDRYFQVEIEDDDVSEQKTEQALLDLLLGQESTDLEGLRSTVLEGDVERSVLAIEIANTFRQKGSGTSTAMLDFVVAARERYLSSPQSPGMSAAERLLAREIHFALETQLLPLQTLVQQFGYQELVSVAGSTRRALRFDQDSVKPTYEPLVRLWIDEISQDDQHAIAARPELLSMTALTKWVDDDEANSGFVADRIMDVDGLIEVATSFITFTTVHGGPHLEYDLTFNWEAFKFAFGPALERFAGQLRTLPAMDVPSYEVADRLDTELSEAERRDFAVKQLTKMLSR